MPDEVKVPPRADEHKAAPEAKKAPETFGGKIADLSARFDTAAGMRDAEAIEGCYKDLDALKPSKPDEEQAYLALSRRFAHFAPRKLGKVKAIEAGLDAGLSGKHKAAKVMVEHPAVAKARGDLAALQAEHAAHVMLPEEAKAIEALESKIANAPLVEEV